MPRLLSSVIRHAHHINPLLPLLLRTCRDLRSARNELRWLREHLLNPARARPQQRAWRKRLYQLCIERSRGNPLQYILGNQPFGDLDIICKPGVLIPRPETEAYTIHLANHITHGTLKQLTTNGPPIFPQLRILDLCTGTGCIPLLLHAILSPHRPDLQLLGIDVSFEAIALANHNLRWNVGLSQLHQVAYEQLQFKQGDIFRDNAIWHDDWDIVVSNPPYISPRSFIAETSRSVRNFEPKSALVPQVDCAIAGGHKNAPEQDLAVGDAFYPRLLQIAEQVNAKLLLMEVADVEQAKRVIALALESDHWDRCEIWRDWPKQGGTSDRENLRIKSKTVTIMGEGHGRSVILWKAGERVG